MPIMSSNMRRNKRKSASRRSSRSNGTSIDYKSLEQRLALTSFVVTSLGDGIVDDGLVTFREAIVAANTNAVSGDAVAGEATGDVIQFDSSLAGGTINLTEGQLTISDDLAIQAGGLDITVDARGLSRAFEITGSESVSLGRLNVTGGNADIGGAVLASGSGTVVVFGGEYSGNIATGDGGGAIYSGAASDLFVSGGAIFDGNFAGGASGSGGAILNVDGTAAANDAVFTANVANRAGGAIEITGGNLFLTDTLFGSVDPLDGNLAGPNGSISGNGGAIHVAGGNQVAITDSIFDSNFAASQGGAIWNQAGTTLFLNSSGVDGAETRFQSNTAAGEGAEDGGGAIFNNGGDLVANSVTFDQNDASGIVGSGGAILSTDGRVLIRGDSEITINQAARSGGAIKIIDGEFFDTDTRYTGNFTGQLPSTSPPSNPGLGGAVHVAGNALVVFNGSNFTDNVANEEGGAVWNSAKSTAYFTDVELTTNAARGDDTGGGGIFNNGGNVFVNGGVFNENSAMGTFGSGGAIFSTDGRVAINGNSEFNRNFSARAGGAVEIVDGQFFDTDSLYLQNNAGVTLSANPGNGGAVHITGTATSAFSATEFRGNLANRDGGAVYNSAEATMFLSDVTITGNFAGGNELDSGGGGIFNNGGSVYVNNSSIADNEASGISGSGGGVFSTGGLIRFDNSTISNNSVSGNGGGVQVMSGRAVFRFSTLDANQANDGGNGGGLHVSGSGAIATFSASTVSRNSASKQGGGVWNQLGSSVLVDSATEFDSNLARELGGGAYNQGNLAVLDAIFSFNISDDGGAFYNAFSGTTLIENTTISGNVATIGGGFYNLGELTVTGSQFLGNTGTTSNAISFTGPEATSNIAADNFFAGNFFPNPVTGD